MNKYKLFLSGLLVIVIVDMSTAQSVKYNVGDSTKMTVSGTSTLHDWTSTVNTVNGFVEVNEQFISSGKLSEGASVKAVHIVVPVTSIISPRGATMDKKTYAALKSDVFPEIIFDLKHNEISDASGKTFNVKCKGELTVAGKSKEVEFQVSGLILSENEMSFTGSYKLNMKEYDMEPPSAMYGTIVTGESVEINFVLVVGK